jgi:hypothetical protein
MLKLPVTHLFIMFPSFILHCVETHENGRCNLFQMHGLSDMKMQETCRPVFRAGVSNKMYRAYRPMTLTLQFEAIYTYIARKSPPPQKKLQYYNSYKNITGSWDSAVGIANGYGMEGRGGHSSSSGRGEVFLLSTLSRPILGPTRTPIQWVPKSLSPGAKRSGCEAHHSPPAIVEVKNKWIYTSTPPYT